MTIQLQAGKKYVTRDGSVYGPLLYDNDYGVFKVAGDCEAGYWFKNGVFCYHPLVEGTRDFVAEYLDKSKFLVAGKKYHFRAVAVNTLERRDAVCLTTTEKQAVMLVYRNGYRNVEDFYVSPTPISNEDGRYTPVESFDEAKPQENF